MEQRVQLDQPDLRDLLEALVLRGQQDQEDLQDQLDQQVQV